MNLHSLRTRFIYNSFSIIKIFKVNIVRDLTVKMISVNGELKYMR